MALEKELVVTLFDEIITKENSKKELSAEIKLAKETFAETNNISISAVNEGLRDYKKFLKDQQEFSVIDLERNQIVDLLYAENATTEVVTDTLADEE